jgi:hypothetical protein
MGHFKLLIETLLSLAAAFCVLLAIAIAKHKKLEPTIAPDGYQEGEDG